MRVTNNMIMNTTKSNINRNKIEVDRMNTQMSTQKKIDVPSDDPVIAVRSLRLRSTLNQIDQYLNTNVKDAESWIEMTQSSLKTLNTVLDKIHTQCNDGSNTYLTQSDRNTILTQLKQLRDQIYQEGNNDYAGRTIFTGYKTNTTLTFQTDSKASYTITEPSSYENIEEKDYYTHTFESFSDVPANKPAADVDKVTIQRIRLSYNAIENPTDITFTYKMQDGTTATEVLDTTGAGASANGFTFKQMTNSNLNAADYAIGDDEVILNTDTGELLLGKNAADFIRSNKASVSVTYDKTGFNEGELRPEHYFNCTDKTDTANPVKYINYNENGERMYQDINYYIGNNQSITVNTLAADTFNASIGRDVDELSDAVQFAMDAYDTLEKIKVMQSSERYSSDTDQEKLQAWYEAAQRQLDYANQNMQDLYNAKLTTVDNYTKDVNLALTTVGAKGQRLDLVKNRLESNMTTVEKLKSDNEDRELSDIVIDYTASYTAYQAALQAASKVQEQTLLDYL